MFSPAVSEGRDRVAVLPSRFVRLLTAFALVYSFRQSVHDEARIGHPRVGYRANPFTHQRPLAAAHGAAHLAASTCAQSVYEVDTAETAVPPSVSPEALFLCACRALAYSVSSAAAAMSPLDSLRGHAAAAAAAGGAIDHVDANRLRCLGLVAKALRNAAGQAGLEEKVKWSCFLCALCYVACTQFRVFSVGAWLSGRVLSRGE